MKIRKNKKAKLRLRFFCILNNQSLIPFFLRFAIKSTAII